MRKIKREVYLPYTIGLGLVLFPLAAPLFSMFGRIIFAIEAANTKIKEWDWGSKWVYIPILTFIGVAVIRLALYHTLNELYTVVFMSIMATLYLASRQLGDKIFKLFPTFIVISVISILIFRAIHPDVITGGIIGAYNRGAGLLAYMAILSRGKWQWLIVTIAAVGILLTGSAEGIFIISAMLLVVLIRRDWGKRLWIPLGIIGILGLLYVLFGNASALYWRFLANLRALPFVFTGGETAIFSAFTGRIEVYIQALTQLSILGHGYVNNVFDNSTLVHNVPLVVFDQLGIFAGIAWIVATVYCLIKTGWKYAWAMVLVLSVFDHYVWTQFAPLFWCLLGVSTSTKNKKDFIFRSADGQPQP